MSLIVRNNPSLTPANGAHASASAGGASVKWLWAAVGALGVSVLALGATLVVQQRGNAPADAAAQVAQLAPNAQRTPESEVINERAGAAPARLSQAGLWRGGRGSHRLKRCQPAP